MAGSVIMNDERGSEVAVEHFVELGHCKLGHIAGPPTVDTRRRRLAGFRAAVRKHKLPVNETWISISDYIEAGGVEAAKALLAQSSSDFPTALYIASFLSGLGAMQVLKEAGLSIPDDLSIIVSDELALAAHTDPPLTTVLMPVRRMGEVATNMLLKATANEPVADIVLSDEPRLIVRASVAPPRGEALRKGPSVNR